MSFPKSLTTLAALVVLSAFASTSVHADPAPNLTNVHIYAVYSSNCGWEYPAVGAFATSCNHGDAVLRAITLEFGYGVNPVATMNGGVLSSSKLLASATVCGTPSNFTLNCSAGQTVTGFAYEYDLNGNQNDIFTYQNTSINGGGTFFTQISIL